MKGRTEFLSNSNVLYFPLKSLRRSERYDIFVHEVEFRFWPSKKFHPVIQIPSVGGGMRRMKEESHLWTKEQREMRVRVC